MGESLCGGGACHLCLCRAAQAARAPAFSVSSTPPEGRVGRGGGFRGRRKKKAMVYAPLDAAVDRTAVTHHRHATCAGRARQRGEQVHILRGQGGGVIGRPLIFC